MALLVVLLLVRTKVAPVIPCNVIQGAHYPKVVGEYETKARSSEPDTTANDETTIETAVRGRQ